ncbi:beta strand repeat-containing protein [Haloferula rosea]|uniref:VCBS domain-containing protein n=1 Tax=Haloferula rosea TaxID=490093 RepID=A0A934RBH2_9BACT|nr:LamG-like jellyroll fold domain-containing protein [Haloferula rosea]MBK1827992.1 VCBS domain-containing protein [Haloferula rosea]
MNSSTPLGTAACSACLSLIVFSSQAQASVGAVDDGDALTPVATVDEDTTLDTSGGLSVTDNDSGIFEITGFAPVSSKGAAVTVSADGTFLFDPTYSGDAQALSAGASLIDTFQYTITQISVPGVTFELDPSNSIDTFPWSGLNAPVAATGTGVPSEITMAYQSPPGGDRGTFHGAPNYDLNDASFEFWIKPDVTNADQVIFETGGNGTGSALVVNDDATVSWVVRNGSIPFVQSSTTLVVGQWHHIVATYDKNNPGSTDTVELFIDGASEGTATALNADDWSGTDLAGLGRRNGTTAADNVNVDGDGTNENYGNFTGQIGLARFWTGEVLDLAKVTSNRDLALNGPSVDTATVSVEVTGANDLPRALDDGIASPTIAEDGSGVAFSENLLTNDGGVVRSVGSPATSLLLWNYDASQSAGAGVWENVGPVSGANADWNLSGGVTLDASPATSISGITAAYDFDGVDDSGVLAGGAPESILGNATTVRNGAFEIWFKPDNLTQTATLTEFAGTTGSGIGVEGPLLVAGSTGGARVTYDLLNDPASLLGAGATTEFIQVMAVYAVEESTPELRLFVNGTFVGRADMAADWASTDGSGMARWAGTHVGGILNNGSGSPYDTYFDGSIAIARLYGSATAGLPAFSGLEARQNFVAVNGALDLEGDSYTVAGIVDGAMAVQGVGSPATIASGAIVTLDSNTGSFTYDPNGAFDSLATGLSATDEFFYQIDDGNGGTGSAKVTVTIEGRTDAVGDVIAATEAVVTQFKANQIVGNDQHTLATTDAFFSVDAASVSGSNWFNIGSGGATYDVNVTGGTLINPPLLDSNFGAIGAAWRNVAGVVTSVQPIADDDATFEVWFRPEPLQTGKQVLLESGGNGFGMSIVFDADANTVIFTIDGGDNVTDVIKATATGVVTGEFNQLIAVYDRDNPGLEDSLTMYLNNDPGASFDSTVKGSGVNAAGLTDQWSGGDPTGIGATAATAALGEVLDPFLGDISIVRIYARKLSALEMEANFDSVVQKILNIEGNGPGVSYTTALGATVTLNADGSFDYDATGLSADIPDGNVVQDSFDYTISDDQGGSTTATVTVNVTGVDNSFVAVNDDVTVGESSGPTSIAVLANDTQTAATVVLQSLESGYESAFENGVTVGDLGNALSGNWSYLWNAPTDWASNSSSDASTGGFGVSADYEPLVWSGTQWTADGDDITSDPLTAFLRLAPTGGHPGVGSTSSVGIGNDKARGPIAAYTVPTSGVFGIGNSILSKVSGSGDAVSAEVYVNDVFKGSFSAAPGGSIGFDGNLGFLTAGDVIYVGVSPGPTAGSDSFTWSFDVIELPSVDAQVLDIVGSVTTDGTTVTYDPGANFDSLKVGQSVQETLTYTLDEGGNTSTATLTITVQGENDAPIGVADSADVLENGTGSGSVLGNDTDVDAGESATLVVGEVEGSAGNVGAATVLASGAIVTMQTDGSFIYDPNGAFDSLDLGQTAQDTFEYTVQDENGLNAVASTTVTLDILGVVPNNGQPTATNLTQTMIYSSTASGVLIDPVIRVADPNDGITSLSDADFLWDGISTSFPGGGSDDNKFGSSDPVDVDGFAIKLAFVPTAADLGAGIVRVLYEYGGISNGHGIYLYEGVPHLLVKMQGNNGDDPAALSDFDWAGNVVCVPLTGAVVPVGEATDLAVKFTLDEVEVMVNGGAVQSTALVNRGGKTNWSGNLSVSIGEAAPLGNNGGASTDAGLFAEADLSHPEGPVIDCRFWNVTEVGMLAFDPEIETATLSVNPAEGALSVPAGASFDGTTWIYSGTPSQVNAALSLVEFLPNGTSPADVSVDIRDGEEDGAVPLTGVLTFQQANEIQDWRLSNFGTALNTGVAADDSDAGDSDSLVNILEFGFGTDPNVADNQPLEPDGSSYGTPTVRIDFTGGVTFDALFVRRDDFGQPGSVEYTVEFSADLNTFYASSASVTTVVDPADDYHIASVPYPPILPDGKKARFYRVRVEAVE